MKVLEIIGTVLLACYILLTLISVFANKKLPFLPKLIFICACASLLAFVVCLAIKTKLIGLLLSGLILLHIGAVISGLKLHGKLNPSHHIIRLALSIGLFLLFIL